MTGTSRVGSIDAIQSSQYKFPYHYIPSVVGFPNFSRGWGYSASYIAAIHITREWILGLSVDAGHRHIDFGCGDGGFVNALAELDADSGIEFEGIDFDEQAIRWAKMFSKRPENFRVEDVRNLPTGTYDTGTLIEVFEHIPPSDAGWFVRSLANALKDDGQLFVTVPSLEKALTDKHYRHFDFDTLTKAFSEHFDVLDIFAFERRSLLQILLAKITNNRFLTFESPLTNRFLISQFAARHQSLSGCGRIATLLQKKTKRRS